MIDLQELSTGKSSQNERTHTLVNISSPLFSQIKDFAKKSDVHISDVFLGAFKLLIYKYTNSDSITIGYLPNNLTDTMIVSGKIDANNTFSNLLKNNIFEVINALKYSSTYNLPRLAASIQIQNEIDDPMPGNELGPPDPIAKTYSEIHPSFHLKIILKENKCSILINFDRNQLQDWQVASYISSYQHILKLVTEKKYQQIPIKSIEILSLQEQHLLLKEWNGNSEGFSIAEYGRIDEAFAAICKIRSDQIAIHALDKDYTYSEINLWSDNFSQILAHIVDGNLIAIAMEKSIDLIIATIAAFKANLTYLPVDPKYPAERIQYMLEDSKCNTLLTNTKISDLDSGNSIRLFSFKDLNRYIPNKQTPEKKDNPVACILYTSGSTGKPKPAMVPHRGITNLIFNQLKYFKISEKDRVLMFASISFDSSIAETWLPLLSGAALVIPQDKYLAGELLAKTILEKRISFLIIPPSILDTMPNASLVGTSLKTVISVGEALTTATVEKWRPNLNNLINTYGPSEASVCTTFYHYDKDIANNIIGKPLDGVKVYILNSDRSLSPIGCIGELYIGGLGLGPGYYLHAELDQERFIKNPFNPQEKIYKTGDLVRWLHDGNIQYIGRIDRQVKFNGIRIELEEIENQLSNHPMVNLCAVVMEDCETHKEKKLVAFFTANALDVPNSNVQQTIRTYLLNKLPPSIVPHKYILLEEFPRLPNGKLDRNKLNSSSYETDYASSQDPIVGSLSAVEQKIAVIYAQVLHLDTQQVSSESDFFLLGATSLQAINALALLNKEFQVSLTLEDFFSDSRVQSIAQKVMTHSDNDASNSINELTDLYIICLGLNRNQPIDCNLDFFSLGGTSLSALKLLAEIKNKYSIDISIDNFFAKSSINDLIPILFDSSKKMPEDIAIDQENFFEDDLFFDLESIASGNERMISELKPEGLAKNILITGSSGFLGAYLLDSLLKNFENATMHCLVRGNVDSHWKLRNALKKYHLNDIDFNRIKVYPADIAKPNLGLSAEDYDYLEKTVDCIYHCAAAVNHIYTYDMLRSANVLGTIEILKLAFSTKKKAIHYISALDISMLKQQCPNFLNEKIEVQKEIGYIQTKWVSEYLLEKATSLLGLNVRIYRPGNIVGDLKQGIMEPATNHFAMFTKGCIQLGYGPDCHFLIEMTPVDVVSESIIKLSMHANNKEFLVYKLHNPHYISWKEYTDMLIQLGYRLDLIDMSEWMNVHLANTDSENALFLLKSYYMQNGIRMNIGLKEIANAETLQALSEISVTFPKDYSTIVRSYINQLREVNFL